MYSVHASISKCKPGKGVWGASTHTNGKKSENNSWIIVTFKCELCARCFHTQKIYVRRCVFFNFSFFIVFYFLLFFPFFFVHSFPNGLILVRCFHSLKSLNFVDVVCFFLTLEFEEVNAFKQKWILFTYIHTCECECEEKRLAFCFATTQKLKEKKSVL